MGALDNLGIEVSDRVAKPLSVILEGIPGPKLVKEPANYRDTATAARTARSAKRFEKLKSAQAKRKKEEARLLKAEGEFKTREGTITGGEMQVKRAISLKKQMEEITGREDAVGVISSKANAKAQEELKLNKLRQARGEKLRFETSKAFDRRVESAYGKKIAASSNVSVTKGGYGTDSKATAHFALKPTSNKKKIRVAGQDRRDRMLQGSRFQGRGSGSKARGF